METEAQQAPSLLAPEPQEALQPPSPHSRDPELTGALHSPSPLSLQVTKLQEYSGENELEVVEHAPNEEDSSGEPLAKKQKVASENV